MDEKSANRLNLYAVVRDLGFVPWMLGILIGMPSVVSIYQMIFVTHTLSTVPQEFIDGFNDLLDMFGDIIEPHLQTPLNWVGGVIGYELTLRAYWRPVFLISIILEIASIRTQTEWNTAQIVKAAFGTIFLFIGSCLVGVVQFESIPLTQGLIASIPILFFHLGIKAFVLYASIVIWRFEFLIETVREIPGDLLFLIVLFDTAVILSFVPGLETGAGLLTLGATVIYWGVSRIFHGVREGDLKGARSGLIALGGFIGAGLVYLLDWALLS